MVRDEYRSFDSWKLSKSCLSIEINIKFLNEAMKKSCFGYLIKFCQTRTIKESITED